MYLAYTAGQRCSNTPERLLKSMHVRGDKNFIMLPRTIKVKWELGSDGFSLHLNDFEHKTLLLFPFLLLENYLPFMPCVLCKARLSLETNRKNLLH